MYKKIAKYFAIYYLMGIVFFVFMTSVWQEDGIWWLHYEQLGAFVTSPMAWLQIVVWPMFIACYLPENFICHA